MQVAPVVAKNIQVHWIYHCLQWVTPAPWKKKSGRQVAFHSSHSVPKKKSEPFQGTNDAVIAYIHQLLPSKRNKKDTVFYSTLLQTSKKGSQGVLLYSRSLTLQ